MVVGENGRVADKEEVGESLLFARDVAVGGYQQFLAAGFDSKVCGIVYDSSRRVVSGMPLGGVDTGCVDLETSGLLGYSTVFNSHVPRGGPLNSPLFGLRVGESVWALTTGLAKGSQEPRVAFADRDSSPIEVPPAPVEQLDLGVGMAEDIRYWGHYPIADLEFLTTAPVGVWLRAWSPFIPGDLGGSTVPGAVFQLHLRNEGPGTVEGSVVFSFDGPTVGEAGGSYMKRVDVEGPVRGVEVDCGECGFAMGLVGGGEGVWTGAALGADREAWAGVGKVGTEVPSEGRGGSVVVPFRLGPNEAIAQVFVLGWWAPRWWGEGSPAGGGNRYTHYYSRRWRSAKEVLLHLAAEHERLLARVIEWQSAVYKSEELPVWLRSALVNVLHLITEDGLWAVARDVGDWCRPEDGLFGLIESPRSCPQIECIPCSFYGAVPLPYFFPDLARSTLRGYRAYQYPNGEVPWIFGGVTAAPGLGRKYCCEMVYPSPGYQTSLNGVCYVALIDRYWQVTGDMALLEEFYDSVKRAVEFTVNLRPEYTDIGQRVVAMPTGDVGTEWFEAPEPGWFGITNHVGGLRLAMLAMAERMARAVGDTEFAKRCDEWRLAGSRAMESGLWAGNYYRPCLDPETGASSDLIFGYQLDGEWLARFHGLEGVFERERVAATLETIWKANVALTRHGAVNYASPDGRLADVGGYGPYSMFPPEVLMLAMTYMYAGQLGRGEELARRCWENIECRQGLTWDQPNVFRGDADTGERVFGADYYQNMMLWALPAALAGEELASVARPGGLVDRVLRAGSLRRKRLVEE